MAAAFNPSIARSGKATSANPHAVQASHGPLRPCGSRHRFHSAIACEGGDAPSPAATEESAAKKPTDMLTKVPKSFLDIIEGAAGAVQKAEEDGLKLLEVDFPAVSSSKIESQGLSSYDILGENLRWVLEFGTRLAPGSDGKPRTIALTLADTVERKQALDFFGGKEEPAPGFKLWSLVDGDTPVNEFNPAKILGSFFKAGSNVKPDPTADMYIIVGVSAQELPQIRKLHELDPTKPIVFFNLDLFKARGDLGLPAFPGRNLHWEFLCKVKPAYYFKAQANSLTLSVKPFLLTFQGILLKKYTEPWQLILDKGDGDYRVVATPEERPSTSEFSNILTRDLKLGVAQKDSIISKEYSSNIWFEVDKDNKAVSRDWRT